MTLADTTSGDASMLLQMLIKEADAVRQFVDLLKREQSALSSGDTDDLPEIAEEKIQLAKHLDQLAASRCTSLIAQGFATNHAGIEAWCTEHPARETAINSWSKILELAREAHELNRLNGELIRLRMQFNAKALEALRVGESSLGLYGPDGQSTKPGHRRIDHAV